MALYFLNKKYKHSANPKFSVLLNTNASNNTMYFFQENFRNGKTVPNFVSYTTKNKRWARNHMG